MGLRTPIRSPAPTRYPVAVVLGLLLRGDRLAALRPRPRAGRAGEPAGRAAPRRLHRPHDLLAPAGLAGPARPSTTSPRAAPSRPRRSSRRCWPGPGGSPSATRPPSRGSPRRSTGWRANRDLDGRRAAVDPPARRVGARRLAQVRPGLGAAGEHSDRFPLPGAPQPPARLRRAAGARSRRPGPLRGAGQHDVVALPAGAGAALGDPGAGRAALGRAARAVPRRGPAGRRPPRRPHLGGAGPARPARPAGGDRPPPGRGAPAERARVPHPGRAALGRRLASRATSPAAAAARSAATGAARPGSTRPGWSGSGCAASATSGRPSEWRRD